MRAVSYIEDGSRRLGLLKGERVVPVASLDPETPYALLAFAPQFRLHDLPTTSRRQALECEQAALAAGLKRVRVGNLGLLS